MAAPVVVILAAGQGTRMRSATPKLLHEVCGRAMIAWPVAAARAAGAGKVVVVEGPDRPLGPALDGEVTFAVQEQALGTADAVKAAAAHIAPGDTVIVLNADHPLVTAETLVGLAEAHACSGAAATLATAVVDDPGGYGRVVRAPDGTVERVVETKTAGDATELELRIREISTGIYAFEGAALITALGEVTPHNAQGEFYLPDVLPIMRAHERSVRAHEINDTSELGINDRVGLAAVTAVVQRRIHERHMLAGVTIVNPDATVIDVDVRIGQDTVIHPFTSLHGATEIGAGARIGPATTMIDTLVGDGAMIVHSYMKGADVGEGASVGPFAYLRPGAVLRKGSKAGTFVEIKNSDIGAGTKVPHLSYIGDTDIGEKTNIGAGTITANYDGTNKHRTTIGSGAFVSVDTMFVAPVSLGDGAFTGAGSVITDDVPPGALGIARARQRNVEGYGERRNQRKLESRDGDGSDKNVPEGGASDNSDTRQSTPSSQ
ncbi:MAG TPA: bifunctional UDP-N-acetylglucosamine diphosphorylase/glucosamine-1-phosphate N-acetyltransferase GlmU [Solirubrobacteraceae bacterium]|nr:bifunctional UDP-N-acetylglucosamine diphosphorylase/glucosamine-1-phosphate N-acetyltransferase GlmU [Solirubrobacteraceae bacterium]